MAGGLMDNPLYQITGLGSQPPTGPMGTLAALRATDAARVPSQFQGYNTPAGATPTVPLPDFSPPDVATSIDEGSGRAVRDSGRAPQMDNMGLPVGTSESGGVGGVSSDVLNLAKALAPGGDPQSMALMRAGLSMANAGSHNSNFLASLSEGAESGFNELQRQRALRADWALKNAQFQSENQLRQAQAINLGRENFVASYPYLVAAAKKSNQPQQGMGPMGVPVWIMPDGSLQQTNPSGANTSPGPSPVGGAAGNTQAMPPQAGGPAGTVTAPAPAANAGLAGDAATTVPTPYLPPGITKDMYDAQALLAGVSGPAGDAARSKLTEWGASNPDYKAEVAGKEAKARSPYTVLNRSEGQGFAGSGPGPAGIQPPAAPVSATGAPTATPTNATSAPTAPVPAYGGNVMGALPKAMPLPQPTDVGSRAQVQELGKQLGELGPKIDEGATNAVNSNYLIDQMRQESRTWPMGKFANISGEANALLDGYREQFNLPGVQAAGDYQAFNKNAMELARQTVRATSARAAYQEMTLIQSALPKADMSRIGFSQIADQLQGANDFALAQQQAKNNWMQQNGGNLNGFESWFNRSLSPGVFLINRMDPDARTKVFNKLSATDNGRKLIDKWAQQGQYARSIGLIQ